nr:apoptosis inducing factor 2 [Holothuria leucospilota]
MGSQQSALQEKKIVVVGGGFAGAHAAKHLKDKCHLTIIDPREYLHYTIGSLRASVEPGFESKIFVPHADAWGDSFKQGWATSIDPKKKVVVLESCEEVPYDIVIIATGSSGPFPGKLGLNIVTSEEAETHYQKLQEQIKLASKITIVGGGAIGIEMAGEIKSDFPGKDITVVDSGADIVHSSFKEKFRQRARKQLEDMGVNLLLGETVCNVDELFTDGSETCTVKTDTGQEIISDLVILATGLHANSDAYESNFADRMDDKRLLKVNDFLQVEGYEDVFAIGDCNNADQVKMAVKAQNQMAVLAYNLEALATNRRMKPYKEESIMSLSLGRNAGVTQFKSFVFGPLFTKKLKSEDVWIGQFWKETMKLNLQN